MTRGKRVSPVGPLPGSAAGFAGDVRDWFHSGRYSAAPARSVAATDTSGNTWRRST